MVKIDTFIKSTENTNNNIPKLIIQTYHNNNIHPKIYNNIQKILKLNTDYDYRLITDKIGIYLIKKYFNKNILNAFYKLNIGAAKGDFLRYISLYIYGGIYIDLDSSETDRLNKYINHDKDHYFFYDNDYNIVNNPIITKPKNIIILNIINEMVKRINNNEQNIFLSTGPTLFTDVIYYSITDKYIYNTKKHISNKDRKQLWSK